MLMAQALAENWLNKGSKPVVMLYLSRLRKDPWRTWRAPFLRTKNSQSRTLLCNKHIFIQLGYIFHTYTHSPLPGPHKQWPTFYSFPDYSENSQFDNPAVLGLCLLHPLSQETAGYNISSSGLLFCFILCQSARELSMLSVPLVSILNILVNSIRGNTTTTFFIIDATSSSSLPHLPRHLKKNRLCFF